MSDGMGREPAYLSSHATNRYFIPNWGNINQNKEEKMVKNKGAIANELKPFEPTHPGEVLKDEIDCRGISQRQLAHEIGVSSSLLNEVLNGERALNTQLALLLSAALDIDAEPLLRLQAKYDMLTGHKTPSFIQRLNIYSS